MSGDGVRVCVTFDHLGSAAEVGRGQAVVPDPQRADLAIGFPRLLGLLDEVGAPATFFCEGWSALHHPRAIDALLTRGHDVGLHGWVHEPWAELDPDARRRILHDGTAALRNAGVDGPGFRAPGGLAAGGDAALLAEVGITEDSSIQPATCAGSTTAPLTSLAPPSMAPTAMGHGLINVPFAWPAVDYWAYEMNPADPATPADLPTRWRGLLDDARARPDRLLVLVMHPGCSGVPDDKFAAAQEFVRFCAGEPDVAFRTVRSIADEHRAATHQDRRATASAAGSGSPTAAPAATPAGAPDEPAWFAGVDIPTAPPASGAPPAAWRPYLADRGLAAPDAEPCTVLPGGVSGEVGRVGAVVVKRPRRHLDVADDWHAGTTRVLAEGAAMRTAGDLAPRVLHVDEHHRLLVQSFEPGTSWKDELLAGRVDLAVTALVADAVRRLRTLPGPEGADRFRRLRLEPYFGVAARRRPELAGELHAVRERLASTRSGLVHGDLSPKNVLVDRTGERLRIVVLDWEVAHAGDPAFDLAFLLSHLHAKAVAVPGADFAPAARILRAAAPELDEQWLRRVTGALLIARAHGTSRLEYLDDAGRASLTRTGTALLRATGTERTLW